MKEQSRLKEILKVKQMSETKKSVWGADERPKVGDIEPLETSRIVANNMDEQDALVTSLIRAIDETHPDDIHEVSLETVVRDDITSYTLNLSVLHGDSYWRGRISATDDIIAMLREEIRSAGDRREYYERKIKE